MLMRGKWFAGLPASLRRELLAHGQIRRFRRGSWVYLQGDPPRGLWAVLEGEVAFSKVGGSGTEVVYHVGGPGLWFGVLGVLTGLPLGLAVTAVSDLKLVYVQRRDILAIIDREPAPRPAPGPVAAGADRRPTRLGRAHRPTEPEEPGRVEVAAAVAHGDRSRQRRARASATGVTVPAGRDDRTVAPVGQPCAPRAFGGRCGDRRIPADRHRRSGAARDDRQHTGMSEDTPCQPANLGCATPTTPGIRVAKIPPACGCRASVPGVGFMPIEVM